MRRLLRVYVLVLAGCIAACGTTEPVVGSPGLEPPHGNEDGGVGPGRDPEGHGSRDAGIDGTPDEPPGGALAGAGGATEPTTSPPPSIDGGREGDAGSVPFSELHLAELTKDCRDRVQCLLQQGAPLEPDPLDGCLRNSIALLDASEQQQKRFLTIFERCGALSVCDYYDCVNSQP